MTLKAFRRDRLKRAAQQSQVQVLLASLPQNIIYTTGGYVSVNQFLLCSTQSYVLYVPADDRLIYVVGHGEIPSVWEFEQRDAEIYCYGAFRFACSDDYPKKELLAHYEAAAFATAEEALATALRDVVKPGDRVAADYSKIPFATSNHLRRCFPDADFVDGLPVFCDARKVKAPEEIAGIERAARLAEDGLLAALDAFRVGDAEQDLERSYLRYLSAHGAKPIFFVATANLRAAFSDTVNQPVPIGPGSMIRFDFGCEIDGYTSDLARTASVGQPAPRVRLAYDAVYAGTMAAIGAARPGIPASRLFEAAVQAVRANGLPDYRRHHVGHGIGLEVYDLPSLTPAWDGLLEENMVVNIETPYYELGWGGVQVEDTVVLTADGCRRLDRSDNRLIVLPA